MASSAEQADEEQFSGGVRVQTSCYKEVGQREAVLRRVRFDMLVEVGTANRGFGPFRG